jgi:hypothetical protein
MSQEIETEVQKEQNAEQQRELSAEEKRNLLFGTIQYGDDSSYEKFLSEMNINQAVFVLIASANYAQAKGAFNLLESEMIATAIRTIRKSSTSEEKPQE